MDIGKPLQWFLVCPKNMLYTFRLNWKCFTFQLLVLFYFWLLDDHQKLRTIFNAARMAVITFNSSTLLWQISTCVTKAVSCFPHLERETEVRERKNDLPRVIHKISDGASKRTWMAWFRDCLMRQQHLTKVHTIFSLSFTDFSWITPGSGLVAERKEWGLRCIKMHFVISGGCFDFSQLSVVGDVSVRCCARCFPQTVT